MGGMGGMGGGGRRPGGGMGMGGGMALGAGAGLLGGMALGGVSLGTSTPRLLDWTAVDLTLPLGKLTFRRLWVGTM